MTISTIQLRMDNQLYKSKSVLDTLANHVTIREYIDKPIDDELLHRMLNAARRSPTSSNLQAYSFVVVRDQDTKKELAHLAGNQKHIETCSVFIGVCADISRMKKAGQLHGTNIETNLENTLVATVDAALAGMSLANIAESYGLGTCMIGGMRNYPKQVAELLDFPKGVYVVYGLTIGWPDHDRVKKQKPRMEEDAIIHHEKYNRYNHKEHLKNYDQALAAHYRGQDRDTPDAAYTGIIADRFSKGRRPHLRSTLENMGFSFR